MSGSEALWWSKSGKKAYIYQQDQKLIEILRKGLVPTTGLLNL